jgi:hypothetical protein
MKNYVRLGLGLALTSLSIGLVTPVMGKDENPGSPSSIRPTGTVKPADLPTLATISFQTALVTALEAASGSVIKAELEVENSNLMYSFEIVGPDKKITEVEINAGNGKVLAVDKDDGEDEKEAKSEKNEKSEKKK